MTFQFTQPAVLILALDALCNHLQAKGLGNSQNRRDNPRIPGLAAEPPGELPVNLEHLNRQGMKVGQ